MLDLTFELSDKTKQNLNASKIDKSGILGSTKHQEQDQIGLYYSNENENIIEFHLMVIETYILFHEKNVAKGGNRTNDHKNQNTS